MNDLEQSLRRRIRWMTWIVIIGLALSGATAIPLVTELDMLAGLTSSGSPTDSGLAHWIGKVQAALRQTNAQYPFMAYGYDWLAFAHFIIALAFVGALRDPVRNRWLFDFGLLACVLLIPYALIMGQVRGIPFYWRLIDCSFGVGGAIPLWVARRAARKLGGIAANRMTCSSTPQ